MSARQILKVLVLAAAFGIVAGVFKGNATGLRGGIGNLSAPWLLVGLLSGLRCRTSVTGAALGLAGTLSALASFYATLTVVLAGHLGGGGYAHELVVEVQANRIYFVAGLVTGPLMGALGAWLGRRRPEAVWWVAGGLLVGEIIAVALVQGHQLAPRPLYFKWGVDDWTPYVGEAVLGLAVLVLAWRHRHQDRPSRA